VCSMGRGTCILRLQRRCWTRLVGLLESTSVENICDVPSTSSFSTLTLLSSKFSPFKRSSFVLSRSFRAVTTTGAFVVCKTCFARAKPMPRDAGDIKVHGGMLWNQSVQNKTMTYCERVHMLTWIVEILNQTRSMMAYLLLRSTSLLQVRPDLSASTFTVVPHSCALYLNISKIFAR
jgi:hypothetical protein